MKKYLGYIRVSTEEYVKGFGLEAQRSRIVAGYRGLKVGKTGD